MSFIQAGTEREQRTSESNKGDVDTHPPDIGLLWNVVSYRPLIGNHDQVFRSQRGHDLFDLGNWKLLSEDRV